MAYQVIARKWRPQTFEEVTGQEAITRTLANAIAYDRIHHAYLFAGPRGTGKTTTARIFAKALNCHRSDRPVQTPCRTTDDAACASCREIAEGRSIDVLEIDAASNTGVDNVREAIINTVAVRPARDRYKVFIIDEVHMLSGAAFNALLKTLEEPPPRVVFIMATTEKHKVPLTILSRCQEFTFRTIATAKIVERLRFIAESEGVAITEQALVEIARVGQGSMRDAQSAFDQVLSYQSEGPLTPEIVHLALGIAGSELLARTMRAIAQGRRAELLGVVDEIATRGYDLRAFCRDLLAHLRDLLVVRIAGKDAEIIDRLSEDRHELEAQAALFSEEDLIRFFHSLTETERLLRESAQPRYQLEVGLLKLVEIGRIRSLDEAIERLRKLEEALRAGHLASGSAPKERSQAKGDSRSSAGDAEGGAKIPTLRLVANDAVQRKLDDEPLAGGNGKVADRDAVQQRVDDERTAQEAPRIAPESLVQRLKAELEARNRPLVSVALENAHRVAIEGDDLCIEFAPEKKHLRDNLVKQEIARLLRSICSELTGRELGLRILIRDTHRDSAEDEKGMEAKRLREWAENHPNVQHVLRKVRGEVIDVRPIDEDRE